MKVVQSPEVEMDIIAQQAGWAEQQPEVWWDHVCQAIKMLLNQSNADAADIKGIGISYQMHGLVLVDKNLEVLRPSIIWCDSRAVEIGNEAFESLTKEKCLSHLLNSPGNFTASKLKWVQDNEPDIYNRIHKILLPGDYIAMKLTGEINTTISGLSEGIFWDFKKQDVAEFLLDHYQISKELIPQIKDTFCGVKSKAYQKFKGKFLTENHRWAPVFDPRYPEVRSYLINTYKNALVNYNLDAFKLDFIDDFMVYPETELTKENGRDDANVNEAVDRLMTDVITTLRSIKQDIAIEFRQKYIGPTMRKFGNMFRAFDCPNDPVSNRIRITDVKLLCGNTAVHSDMITWHNDEPVEIASLQVLNALWGVPQMSILLKKASKAHIKMLKFYTQYWNENKNVLLDGEFAPANPLGNYPVVKSMLGKKTIIGVFDEAVVETPLISSTTDILNVKRSENIAIRNTHASGSFEITIWDCMGNKKEENVLNLAPGLLDVKVPTGGLLSIKINIVT